MNNDDIRKEVVALIRSVAPEVEESDLASSLPLREQIDLDSMDWLKVILAVHEKLHVDIPEADYGKLRSLDDWVSYLCRRLA